MNRSRLFCALLFLYSMLLVACGEKEISIDVASIAISQPSAEMEIGESLSLKATVSPSNAIFDGYLWTSTNPKVATVTNSGTVTAISEGSTVITVMAGGKTASCAITVVKGFVAVSSVGLNKTTLTMVEGDTETLSATVSPNDATDKTVSWTSSNTEVAIVQDGTITAVMEGVATITAKAGDQTASCTVTVKGVTIELKPATLDLCVGDEADIEACLEPAGATVNVTWESTDLNIASVDGNGHIKALAAGDVVICATTEKGRMAFCKVHVRNKVDSVTITAPSGEREIYIGETLQLKAVVTPADLPGTEIEWTSSDSGIATITSNGLVTAKSKGKATITVTVKNGPGIQTATYDIEVIQPVTSISVSPNTLTMYVGDELEIDEVFTIVLRPEDANDRSVRFGFSRTGILNIENGKLTGLKAGDVVLYFYPKKPSSTELKAECMITVKAKVEGITIDGGDTRTIRVKETVQLKATVTPANADKEVEWSSSKPEIATVSKNGLVTGVKAGTTVITVTSKDNPSIKAICTVTVENIPVESVTLNKSTLTLVEGNTEALTATVKPDDAFDKTLTWSSSDTKIATVSDKGVVTAVKAGTATITAKCGGKTATCEVTVQAKAIAVTGVSLNTSSLTLTVGEKQTLKATVTPSNATNKSVSWSSSNTSIASVSSSGVVTAKAVGTATITVKTKDGGKTAKCTVTVQDKQHEHNFTISSWRLNPDYILGNQDMLNPIDPVNYYQWSAYPFNKDDKGWGAVYGRFGGSDQMYPYYSYLTEHFKEYMVNFKINEESIYRFEIKNFDVSEADWDVYLGLYGTTRYSDGTRHAYVELTGAELIEIASNSTPAPRLFLINEGLLVSRGYDVLVEVKETCAELGNAQYGYYFVVFEGLNAQVKVYNVKLGNFIQNCDYVLAHEVVEGIYDAYNNKLFVWENGSWKATEAAAAYGIYSADKLNVEIRKLIYCYEPDTEESFGGHLYTFSEGQMFEYNSSTLLTAPSDGINWWNYGVKLQVDKKAMFTVTVLWGDYPDEQYLCDNNGTIQILATANSTHPLHNANGTILGPIVHKDGWLYATSN